MELFFSPLACSLGIRIVLDELEIPATFVRVDLATRHLADGRDYREINPMGQVPALRLDDGRVLVENIAILWHLARAWPTSGLLPFDRAKQVEVLRWLSFVSAELHKAVFSPLLSPGANDGAKAWARSGAARRLAVLDAHLAGREHLVNGFGVADAYLTAVLNWAPAVGIELASYPAVAGYFARMRARPSVARSLAEEAALHAEG